MLKKNRTLGGELRNQLGATMEEMLEQSPKDHSKISFIFIKIITFIESQLCVTSCDYEKL